MTRFNVHLDICIIQIAVVLTIFVLKPKLKVGSTFRTVSAPTQHLI